MVRSNLLTGESVNMAKRYEVGTAEELGCDDYNGTVPFVAICTIHRAIYNFETQEEAQEIAKGWGLCRNLCWGFEDEQIREDRRKLRRLAKIYEKEAGPWVLESR